MVSACHPSGPNACCPPYGPRAQQKEEANHYASQFRPYMVPRHVLGGCADAGSTLATGGEDGQVKVWSRAGLLRCTLAQVDSPVHGLAWAPSDDQLAYCAGGRVTIQGVQSARAQVSWRAHAAVVLCLDWSPVSRLIITGGEDCRYKVCRGAGVLAYCRGRCFRATGRLRGARTHAVSCPSDKPRSTSVSNSQ